jgi:predicted MFS family arabinose efflux permease
MLRTKLSIMMFLEFFIWGAWLPIIFAYLPTRGFTSSEQSWILNTFTIASFVGMFFSNQFADRTFAAEKFLGVSHLIGGLSFIALFWAQGFWQFFALMMVHCLFYVPTISITNSVAFANLKDPTNDFGPVRLWGTIGWIAAALPYLWFPERKFMFFWAGGASILLAIFSFVALPHTPPKPAVKGESSLAWLEAAKYLRYPFIFVLYIVTFIDAMVHQGYFLLTETYLQDIGIEKNFTAIVMSVGQIAEIGAVRRLRLLPALDAGGGEHFAARRLLRVLLRDSLHFHR